MTTALHTGSVSSASLNNQSRSGLERPVDRRCVLEPIHRMNPQRLRSSRQDVNERLRHQQGLAQNLVELSDAARQVDVRADHREVQPRARAHVAVGCFPVMESKPR